MKALRGDVRFEGVEYTQCLQPTGEPQQGVLCTMTGYGTL